jgi:hypothetical protein
MANLGKTFAFGAVALHLTAALITLTILMTMKPSDKWTDKYPDRMDRMKALGDFNTPCEKDCVAAPGAANSCTAGCSDHVWLMMDITDFMHDFVPFATLNGICQSVSCLLAIFALLSLKAQLNMKNPSRISDEKELIAFTCFIIGFLIPMLQFAMMTGPLSFVAWVGSTAQKDPPTDDTIWKNFHVHDWHALFLILRIVESIFVWLDSLMCLLLSIGFGAFSMFAAERAKVCVRACVRACMCLPPPPPPKQQQPRSGSSDITIVRVVVGIARRTSSRLFKSRSATAWRRRYYWPSCLACSAKSPGPWKWRSCSSTVSARWLSCRRGLSCWVWAWERSTRSKASTWDC